MEREERWIRVSLGDQRLELVRGDEVLESYPVSSAARGPGEQNGSQCTPRGEHEIHQKIGAGAPAGTAFVGRRPSGEICTPEQFRSQPDRDWILTRILWLAGLEPGRNRGGEIDTLSRYIYIHGCPDEVGIGAPSSHGCIRMRNADVIQLFDEVEVGTRVCIE